jgi:Rieske Fe-S protein
MLVFASRKPTTGGVVSVVAGTGINVNDADPANPVVSAIVAAMTFATLNINVDPSDPNFSQLSDIRQGPNQGGSGPLLASSITSTPFTVAAAGNVTFVGTVEVGNVDTTEVGYVVQATILVSNADGTEVITVTATAVSTENAPDQIVNVDWTTATAFAVAGTDLVWDDTSQITSTAGGVFTVLLKVSTGAS